MKLLYLLRHGAIATDKPGSFVGQRDLPLSPEGREQAVRLAEHLARCAIDRVVCSPLSRCVESARILCRSLGGTPLILPDLREISLGAWEGLTTDEIRERFPGCHEARGRDLAGFRPQDGESFVDLLRRVWPVIEDIVQGTDRRVAIVSHAGVNRVLLCRILGIPLDNLLRLAQDYGCLNVVEYDAHGCRVATFNARPATSSSGFA